MKIIFLDIDGVLNCEDWYRKRFKDTEDNRIMSEYPYYEFDPAIVKRLNKIIEETGAKVVVSSTWRHGRTPEELQSILNGVGFVGEVIDVTPHMNSVLGYTIPRGCEIDYWLERTGKFQRINWSIKVQREYIEKAVVKNYIILDDDSDMLYNQREHFIKTGRMFGLDEECVERSIKILNTPLEELYYSDVKYYDENQITTKNE